jgi:hypothetical protein
VAICDWCNADMMIVTECTGNTKVEFPDGTTLPSIPFENTSGDTMLNNCHDCRVAGGYNHHPGCDDEQCPKCRGQLISCGCLDSESDKDEDHI